METDVLTLIIVDTVSESKLMSALAGAAAVYKVRAVSKIYYGIGKCNYSDH